ncbi:hypothetical protein SAMN05421664_2735 [Chryseobacterium soldanellicola]|uniref:BREX system P-loop protein BrxC n=1 Tax=Chryseobacterium soldanellicola TaxID=311333 RepID=A0A1H1E113_9FLAO|nr:BREX system P-loop protein BrxC [Chryseobacterium soldanellicola]SDQ82333.1 hypothetical protein SAMN05421664_2735 [Chryseobacterium soldanellicola]
MELKEIFARDINRHINPAVVVGQLDKDYIDQEIKEYVFTTDIIGNLFKFINAIANKKEGKTGIWISGYYGSGKSHFIKYLFYCLNRATRKEAFESYKEVLKNSKQLDELSEVTLSNVQLIENKLDKLEVQEIIFNIDYVSQHIKNNNTITRILFNELNAKRGYNKTNIAVAMLIEKRLDQKGQLQSFKDRVREVVGERWNSKTVTNHIQLKLAKIIDVVAEFDADIDKEALRSAIRSDRDFTIEELVAELKEYIQSQPEDFRLVFLMDEVSQYIGNNTDLLLNLQTIVEGFGEHLNNKVWVVCTAQQDLGNLVTETGKKSDGFGKIIGRFETLISLDSQDAAYITQKRVLEKSTDGTKALTQYYKENKGAIENQFVLGHSLYQSYADAENFYLAYPFIPYQFRLISDVFSSFSKVGFVGEGVKNTERAILGITHFTAQKQSEQEVGYFISFDNFFNENLQSNLTHSARAILDRGRSIDFDTEIKQFAYRVINVLFMVSNLEEAISISFPATVENISLLLLNEVKTVKAELQNSVQKVLDILVDKNIVQVSEGKYRFLDDEGIKVANTIAQTEVNANTRLKYFYEQMIRKSLRPESSVKLGNRNIKVNISVDDKEEATGGDFKIKFVVYDPTDPEHQALNVAANELNININEWFNTDQEFKKDFLTYCKTTKYLEDNRSTATGGKVKTLEEFSQNNAKLLKDLQLRFEKAWSHVSFTSAQRVIPANGVGVANPAARYQEMVSKHLESLYKYNQWGESFAQSNTELQSAIEKSIKMPTIDNELDLAEAEVNNKISQSGNEMNLSDLVKLFEKAPYGWKDIATLHIVFNIVKKKHRALFYLNDEMELKQYFDKAINSSSRNSIEVKSSKEYNQEDIEAFKKAVKNIFVTYSFVSGQTVAEMLSDFHEFLGKNLIEINRYKEQYEGYPFTITLKNFLKRLTEIKEIKSNDKLIQKLLENSSSLQTERDAFADLKDFIDNNFSSYNEIRNFVSAEKSNLEKLGETYEERVKEINVYLNNETQPALDFPTYRKMYKDLKKAQEALLDQYRQHAIAAYNEIFDELETEIKKTNLSPNSIPEREYIINRLQKSKDLNFLDLELYKKDDFRLNNLKTIADTVIKIQVSEGGGDEQKYGSKLETINLSSTFAGKTISSAEEVDQLVEKLKNKLMVELGKNGKIFLK